MILRRSHIPHLQAKRTPGQSGGPSGKKRKVRSLFISDLHLGTSESLSEPLCRFLRDCDCEHLYLVGDIFDGWKMRSGVSWSKHANRAIQLVLKKARRGTKVTYITGNHDEFLRRYANRNFDTIALVNRCEHKTADGRRFLVIHGDQFDNATRFSPWLKWVGDVGYAFLMNLTCAIRAVQKRLGSESHWSLAGFVKSYSRHAKRFIDTYEHCAAEAAKKLGFDGIICGHVHHPADKVINGVHYLNTGDWVESCSAIVEHSDGRFEMLRLPYANKKTTPLLSDFSESAHA